MNWYPLKMTFHVNPYVFAERLIADRLEKRGLPEGKVAETWEISAYEDKTGTVTNGALAGRTLSELTAAYPDELVGMGWRGERFPLLEKFIDASGMLPVHLHPDDETAQRKYNEPNGKTEAWYILWARPGASALMGVKPNLTPEEMRAAFERHDYDRVLNRFPVATGDTIYVPGGVLHSFGPDTLIFEVEQTSDLASDVMPSDLQGKSRPFDEWMQKISDTLDELRTDHQPRPQKGLDFDRASGNRYSLGCVSPYFALERWTLHEPHAEPDHPQRCLTLSNIGAPVQIEYDGGMEMLDTAESCLLPAALAGVRVRPTEKNEAAELIACYVPDLQTEIVEPLRRAGHSDAEIAARGEIKF